MPGWLAVPRDWLASLGEIGRFCARTAGIVYSGRVFVFFGEALSTFEIAHRGYHGLAMPSWERKLRVFWGWWNNFWLGRDIVSLAAVQQPRAMTGAGPARMRGVCSVIVTARKGVGFPSHSAHVPRVAR